MRVSTGLVALSLAACRTDGPDHTGDDGVPVTVDQSGAQDCAQPQARSAEGPYQPKAAPVPRPTIPWIWHGGVTVADLDGDGYLDVLTALEQGVAAYHGTADGLFPEVGEQWFGAFDLTYASGVSVADYDGDGDLDVYVMRIAGDPAPEWTEQNEIGRNRLLRNDGGGHFTEVTDQAGVDGCGLDGREPHAYSCWKHMTSSWGDIDGDGDLDLFVGDYGYVDQTNGVTQADMALGERDFLYLNEGDGTFTDASDTLPGDVSNGYAFSGGFFDLDDDGDLDLYTVHDFGKIAPSGLLWNDGAGHFTDDQQQSGLSDPGVTGMGLGLGDLNGDGLPDLAVPIWDDHYLYESLRVGDRIVWANAAGARGVTLDPARTDSYVGWGTEMADVDNDGDLDLVTQFGQLKNANQQVWHNSRLQPDALYVNSTVWSADGKVQSYSFADQAHSWGVDEPSMTRGVALADLNGDGWLDLVKRSLDKGNLMYMSRCGSEGWLEVSLHQPGTLNTDAIGAKVTITTGGRVQSRAITAGGTGYASQGPAVAHFGLGDADAIDSLEVRWPDGKVSRLSEVAARQRISITR